MESSKLVHLDVDEPEIIQRLIEVLKDMHFSEVKADKQAIERLLKQLSRASGNEIWFHQLISELEDYGLLVEGEKLRVASAHQNQIESARKTLLMHKRKENHLELVNKLSKVMIQGGLVMAIAGIFSIIFIPQKTNELAIFGFVAGGTSRTLKEFGDE